MSSIPSLTIILLTIKQIYSGKVCSYLGMEGIGYPVDTCMYQAEADENNPAKIFAFAFEFTCSSASISAIYWEDSTECKGKSDLNMDGYYCAESSDLTGQECKCVGRGAACDTFTIEVSDSRECKDYADESQATSLVVNECIPNGKGGSDYFTCDNDLLIMENFYNCDDCNCIGEISKFDYSYFSDNHCYDIQCTEGVRKKQNCEDRGIKAAANKKLKEEYGYDFGINSIDGLDALDFIDEHVRNHHLFVENIISQYEPSIIMHKKGKHDIFGNDNIWESPVLYVIGAVGVVLIIAGFISWCRYNRDYEKIIEHNIHN